MLYLDFEAQGRGSIYTFCHAHLKKAILHLKMATVRFDLNTAVSEFQWDGNMHDLRDLFDKKTDVISKESHQKST